MANINRETIRILAAIYYDINSVCDIRKRVNSKPKGEDINDYRTACQHASTLVSRAVTQALRHQFSNQQHYDRRLTELTTRLGWKLLSICAHSTAFLQASIRAGVVTWDVLVSQLEANRLSIELFARTRNLEWRGPLLKHARHDLPELQKELAPYIKLYDQHPHHFVRTENKAVRMPVYEEFLQMHTNACTFDPRQWKSYANKEDKSSANSLERFDTGPTEVIPSIVISSMINIFNLLQQFRPNDMETGHDSSTIPATRVPVSILWLLESGLLLSSRQNGIL